FDVSDIDVEGRDGMIVRTPRFSALRPEAEAKALADFEKKFADHEIVKANWSGDILIVRSKKPIANQEAAPVFAGAGLELKECSTDDAGRFTSADEGTGEFRQEFAMWGVDRQFQQLLEKQMPNTEPIVVKKYGVGAKAGDKLRDDATKSIIYAI